MTKTEKQEIEAELLSLYRQLRKLDVLREDYLAEIRALEQKLRRT